MKIQRRAFSLVELLVVITIIGVLLSLLLPVLSKVREYGRGAQCLSNLKELHQAVVNFGAERSGELPASASHESLDRTVRPNIWWQSAYGWVNWLLIPYPTRATSQPGGDKRTYWYGPNGYTCTTNGTLYQYARDIRIYLCPTFARKGVCGRSDPIRSYVMNRTVSWGNATMRGATKTILFADGGMHAFLKKGSATQMAYAGLRGVDPTWNIDTYETTIGDWNSGGDQSLCHYRQLDGEIIGLQCGGNPYPWECIGDYHNDKGNVIFVDGHTERLPLQNQDIRANTTNACSGAWGD